MFKSIKKHRPHGPVFSLLFQMDQVYFLDLVLGLLILGFEGSES